MGLLDQFKAYIQANTPRNTRPAVSPATVINEGLLNPNQFNSVAANRFKDSLLGGLGIVPGVGDVASGMQAADFWNRGEKLNAGLAGLGALPLIPALGAITKGYGVDNALLDRLNKSAPDADAYISGNDDAITLSKIVVPTEMRNQGEGTRFMSELVGYADETGKKVALSPSADFGGNKARLERFYKTFGFVKNKGKNKDFSITEGMIREPKPTGLLSYADEAKKANGGLLANNEPMTSIYHGTTPKAAKAIEKAGFDINKSADGTVWFTSNPNIGEVAASGKGAIVKRLLDEKKMKLGGWDDIDKYSVDELISKGYDGVKLEDGGEITYQIFNPEKLNK